MRSETCRILPPRCSPSVAFWLFLYHDRSVFRSYPAFFSGGAWLIKFCDAVLNLSSLVYFLRFIYFFCTDRGIETCVELLSGLWFAYTVLCNMTRGIRSMQHNFTVQSRGANNCSGQSASTTGWISIMNVDEAKARRKQISAIIVQAFRYFKIKQIPGAISQR